MALATRIGHHADKKYWQQFVSKHNLSKSKGQHERKYEGTYEAKSGRQLPPSEIMRKNHRPVLRDSKGRRDWKAELEADGIDIVS